jgi:hypothetical protein
MQEWLVALTFEERHVLLLSPQKNPLVETIFSMDVLPSH